MEMVRSALRKTAESTGNVVEYTGQLYDRGLVRIGPSSQKCPVATEILAHRHVCGTGF